MLLPKEGSIGMTSRNDKKYIHLDFDDTMTCKQLKAFSSIFPSYGCLYTTVKFVEVWMGMIF